MPKILESLINEEKLLLLSSLTDSSDVSNEVLQRYSEWFESQKIFDLEDFIENMFLKDVKHYKNSVYASRDRNIWCEEEFVNKIRMDEILSSSPLSSPYQKMALISNRFSQFLNHCEMKSFPQTAGEEQLPPTTTNTLCYSKSFIKTREQKLKACGL